MEISVSSQHASCKVHVVEHACAGRRARDDARRASALDPLELRQQLIGRDRGAFSMMAVVCSLSLALLLFSSPAAAAAATSDPIVRPASDAAGSCSAATATTLKVSWAEEPETDMYYVQLTDPSVIGSRPYALQTTAVASVTLVDLVPDTEYTLSVRSHPSDFNIVWGWRPASPTFKCKTMAERVDAPNQLQRVGDGPHESEIALRWSPAQAANIFTTSAHSVGVRLATADSVHSGAEWRWERAASATMHTVHNLASGQRYEVAVRDDISGGVSDPLLMRTAAAGVLYTNAYRISEYTFDGAIGFILLLAVTGMVAFSYTTAETAMLVYVACLCLRLQWTFWITMTQVRRSQFLCMFRTVVVTPSSTARTELLMGTATTRWTSASRHWKPCALRRNTAEQRLIAPRARYVLSRPLCC